MQLTDYQGTTDFHYQRINAIFTDKTLKFNVNNPRADEGHESEHLVKVRDWFAFSGLYGTSEEKACVKMLNTWITDLGDSYDYIYLLRNERHFALYNFSDGRAFEPDFVLFLGKANGESVSYQLFIEPKGAHLIEQERWKEDFLKEICAECHHTTLIENSEYRVVGVPTFYNSERENEFKAKLNETLGIAPQPQESDVQTALDMDN